MAKSVIIRGGQLIDAAARAAGPRDILVIGDAIAEIGPPGLAAPPDAATFDASGTLMHPGLVNSHTHGLCNFLKGRADRWTLELPLDQNPSAVSVSSSDARQLDLSELSDVFLALEYTAREG